MMYIETIIIKVSHDVIFTKLFIIKVKGYISSLTNIVNKGLNAYTFSLFSNFAQKDIKNNMHAFNSLNTSMMHNDLLLLNGT